MRYPPSDLESTADATFLLETTTSRARQAIPDDQMILVDIIIQDPGRSNAQSHVRRVMWSRRFMTREAVLHLLSAHVFCASHVVDCVLIVNRVHWDERDTTVRELHFGDALQLLIQGPRSMSASDVQVDLCEQESADVQRYIYRASPTPSPRSASPPRSDDIPASGRRDTPSDHDGEIPQHEKKKVGSTTN